MVLDHCSGARAHNCEFLPVGAGLNHSLPTLCLTSIQAAEGSIYTSAASFEELNLTPELLKVRTCSDYFAMVHKNGM